jgi:glutamate racemase
MPEVTSGDAERAVAPIGVFDSGLGGLTVVRALQRRLPNESIVYVGDTARVPYGPKSPDTVCRYAVQISEWLVEQGVKLVVVACNTATAHALSLLQDLLPVPVIGVIEPGARAAVQVAPSGTIGVIGTAGTVCSGAYERAIQALDPTRTVNAVACPLLVPLVEEGWMEHAATKLIVGEYLAPLRAAAVRSLVLGCTHYPLLREVLSDAMGPTVTLIDSAEQTAMEVERVLQAHQLVAPPNAEGTLRAVASDAPQHFRTLAGRFLDQPLEAVEHVVFT